MLTIVPLPHSCVRLRPATCSTALSSMCCCTAQSQTVLGYWRCLASAASAVGLVQSLPHSNSNPPSARAVPYSRNSSSHVSAHSVIARPLCSVAEKSTWQSTRLSRLGAIDLQVDFAYTTQSMIVTAPPLLLLLCHCRHHLVLVLLLLLLFLLHLRLVLHPPLHQPLQLSRPIPHLRHPLHPCGL